MKSSISLREVVAQLVAELGEQPLVGHDGVELVDVEPAQREARDERLRARIGEHALDLRFDDVGIAELARGRELQAAPRRARWLQRKNDKREASSKSSSANVSPVIALGRRNRAIEEVRAREHGRHELLDADVEVAGRAAVLVERHQPLEVAGVRGAAERARRERLRDALGARPLVGGRRRRADEDLVAARRARQACRAERPFDSDAADDARHAHLARVAEAAVRLEAEDVVLGRGAGALDERDRDLVNAGRDLHGNLREPLHDLGARRRAAAVAGHELLARRRAACGTPRCGRAA